MRKMFSWSWQVDPWPQPRHHPRSPSPCSCHSCDIWSSLGLDQITLCQISGVVFGEECKKRDKEGSLCCCVLALPTIPDVGDSSPPWHPARLISPGKTLPRLCPSSYPVFLWTVLKLQLFPGSLGCLSSLEPLLCSWFSPHEEHLPCMESHTPWAGLLTCTHWVLFPSIFHHLYCKTASKS